MDSGESVVESCAREAWEETGQTVIVERMIAVCGTPYKLLVYPDGNRWQLVVRHFAATSLSGTLSTSDETAEIGYFSQVDCTLLAIGELDRLRVIDRFAQQTAVLIRYNGREVGDFGT